jgi:hypothetical protein
MTVTTEQVVQKEHFYPFNTSRCKQTGVFVTHLRMKRIEDNFCAWASVVQLNIPIAPVRSIFNIARLHKL